MKPLAHIIECQDAKASSTLRSSRAVPHPSTNRALRRLTSEVRRDPVHSTRYGRQRMQLLRAFKKTKLSFFMRDYKGKCCAEKKGFFEVFYAGFGVRNECARDSAGLRGHERAKFFNVTRTFFDAKINYCQKNH